MGHQPWPWPTIYVLKTILLHGVQAIPYTKNYLDESRAKLIKQVHLAMHKPSTPRQSVALP
eukprot:scaffold39551_cov57-Phaeocystis_antarctica.AAC.7